MHPHAGVDRLTLMADSKARKFWQTSRRIFRWIRILIFFCLFLLIFAMVYLHEVGVPKMIKDPVLAKIHEQGLDIQFDDMRWSWPNSVIIENARVSPTNETAQIKFSAAQLTLGFDLPTSNPKKWKLQTINVKNANVNWATPDATHPEIGFTNINTSVRLRPHDTVDLQKLDAQFTDARIHINGTVTNALAIVDWPMFKKQKGGKSKSNSLQNFVTLWRQIHFTTAPELAINVSGNGRDPASFACIIDLGGSQTTTPWGELETFQANAKLNPSVNGTNSVTVTVIAAGIKSKFATAKQLKADLIFPLSATNVIEPTLTVSAKSIEAQWGARTSNRFTAASVEWSGAAIQYFTNPIPARASGKVHFTRPALALSATNTFRAQTADLQVADFCSTNHVIGTDSSWSYWANLAPFQFRFDGNFTQVAASKLEMAELSCAGEWNAPELILDRLNSTLYSGHLESSWKLNVTNRTVTAQAHSDLDEQQILPLLPDRGQRWLRKYTWEEPPKISATLQATLPAWSEPKPDWQNELLSTLQLNGTVSTTKGSYRRATVLSVKTDFAYSNRVWSLPNLHLTRPEGEADVRMSFDEKNEFNTYVVDSTIDPKAIRTFFPEKQQKLFDLVTLGGPPVLHIDIREHGFDFDDYDIHADIVATNILFRGLDLNRLKASAHLTNDLLRVSNIEAERSTNQIVRSPLVELEISKRLVTLHEIYSTMDPMLVTHAIGKKVAAAIAPYQYSKPPTVYVDGSLIYDRVETADLHFLVEGEKFHWGLLRADTASAKVDWVGTYLTVTNISATAYNSGTISAWVYVDFVPVKGEDFQVGASFTNIDLQPAMMSIGKTNHLEGLLSGRIEITAANTKVFDHWEGFGWLQLKDGFIWDVPVFGIFSQVLNAISPGAGSSRAREASATFVMTNSLVRSDDVEIHSPAVLIKYRGTIDFQKQLNARVEASMLHDLGSVGYVVSVALKPISKIFEYKVTGTIDDPKSEPVYIPTFLMKVLRPFHTLKQMLPEQKKDVEKQSAELKP